MGAKVDRVGREGVDSINVLFWRRHGNTHIQPGKLFPGRRKGRRPRWNCERMLMAAFPRRSLSTHHHLVSSSYSNVSFNPFPTSYQQTIAGVFPSSSSAQEGIQTGNGASILSFATRFNWCKGREAVSNHLRRRRWGDIDQDAFVVGIHLVQSFPQTEIDACGWWWRRRCRCQMLLRLISSQTLPFVGAKKKTSGHDGVSLPSIHPERYLVERCHYLPLCPWSQRRR